MRALQRLGQHLDVVEAEMRALVREALLGPGLQDDLDGFAEALGALLGWHAEGIELRMGKAAAGTPVDPAARQHVEQRHLFGEPQRMIERGQRHRRADAQALGACRRHDAQHVHRGADAESGEMMLGQPHRVEARLVHDLDALERTAVNLFQRAVAARPAEELQDAQFHSAVQ